MWVEGAISTKEEALKSMQRNLLALKATTVANKSTDERMRLFLYEEWMHLCHDNCERLNNIDGLRREP